MRPGSFATRIACARIVARNAFAAFVFASALATTVRADDTADKNARDTNAPAASDVTMDDLAVRESSSLFHDPGEPLLKLDMVPRPSVVGLGVTEDTHRIALQLSPRAKLTFTGTSWKGYADAVPRDGVPDTDVTRGSRREVNLSYDFGSVQLDASVAQNVLSSRYGSGSYRDMSLQVSKSHRFSRWVLGWIGLSIGHRAWDGEPPTGEENSTHFMLSIGWTFR